MKNIKKLHVSETLIGYIFNSYKKARVKIFTNYGINKSIAIKRGVKQRLSLSY
jgi:hypothetical protein